jgi:chemotaxis protein MotB
MASLKSSAGESANQLASVQSERDRLTSELAASQASLAAAQAGAGDKDRLTADLAGAQTERDKLAGDLTAAQAERDKLAGELAASQAERDKLAGELGASQASLQSGVGDRDTLAAELAASQASLAALQAAGAGEKDKQAAELAAAKQRTDDLEKQLADRDRELAGLRGDLSTEMAKLKEAQRGLIRALRPQIENQNITVDLNNERLLINLAAGYLFGSGEDQLKPAGTDALKQVGAILKDFPEYKVAVEGHTDDRPLRPTLKKKFASNKELSEARATNASRALADGGLSGARTSGYADSQPVASNATDGGRAKNRRVEVRVTR